METLAAFGDCARSRRWLLLLGIAVSCMIAPASPEAVTCSQRASHDLYMQAGALVSSTGGDSQTGCGVQASETYVVTNTLSEYSTYGTLLNSLGRDVLNTTSGAIATPGGIKTYASIQAQRLIDSTGLGAGRVDATNSATVRFDSLRLEGVAPGSSVSVRPYFDDFSLLFNPISVGGAQWFCGSSFGCNDPEEVFETTVWFGATIDMTVRASDGSRVLSQSRGFHSDGRWQPLAAGEPGSTAGLWGFQQGRWTRQQQDNLVPGSYQQTYSPHLDDLLQGDLFGSFVMASAETYSLEITFRTSLTFLGLWDYVEWCADPFDPFTCFQYEEFYGDHFGGGAALDANHTLDFGGFIVEEGPLGAAVGSPDGLIVAGQFVAAAPPSLTIVPEPATALLFGGGLLALASGRRSAERGRAREQREPSPTEP